MISLNAQELADLELTEILCLYVPNAVTKSMWHHYLSGYRFISVDMSGILGDKTE